MDLRRVVPQIAQQEGVDPALLARLVGAESGFRAGAVSPRGAIGPAQLMPATAQEVGVNINDPVDNIRGGARYLKKQQARFGDPRLALAAYNAGPGAVAKAGGVPQNGETPAYVDKVMGANQGSDDIFGFSGPSVAPQKGGASDDIFAMKPTVVAPLAPETALAPAKPQSDNAFKQYATGLVEGAKPLGDKFAGLMGVPAILRSPALANTILHAIGRPDMPVAAEPQTLAQSVGRTAGRMTIGAVAPGSVAQRLATVAGPTVGSETGGAAFKGTPLEQPARFAGAVLGGALGGGLAGAADNGLAARANPRVSPAELRQQANSLYTELRNRDVQFTPQAVKSLHDGMNEVVGNLRQTYPSESTWIDTVAQTLSHDPTASTLDTLRSKLQQALTTPTASRTPDQLRVGSQLVDEIDNFMNAAARHPQTMTTGTGNPAQVGALLSQARDVWKRMRNVQTVENLAESAGIQNGSSFMGGNAQNMTGRKLRDFIDPTKNKSLAGLSQQEQKQLRSVVMGTPLSNTLKVLGNLSPTKGVGSLVNTMAAGAFGLQGPMVLAPLGYAANKAGAAVQRAQLDSLLRLLATPKGQQSIPAVPLAVPAAQAAVMGGAAQVPAMAQRRTK